MESRVEDAVEGLGESRNPMRLVPPLICPLLLVPALVLLREPDNPMAMLCLLSGTVALCYSLAADAVERRVGNGFRIQIVNAGFYALMISILLALFVSVEHPRMHLHGVVFFLYFILIGSVGLSDDPRQAVAAGCVSIVGYAGVIVFAHACAADGNLVAQRVLPELDWVSNSVKFTMLACATVVGVASAERGRALRRLSLRDGLTGLLNRRAFDECVARLARATDGDSPEVTIAMIDIDHFKQLNDQYGHALGDRVLRWVASRIERSFRTSDLVARYGGEEFVVALPGASDARIVQRLEVLRAHIATSVLRERRSEGDHETELEIKTTISIGVAHLPADGATPTEVLARADKRLYEAKAAGRNRLVRRPA